MYYYNSGKNNKLQNTNSKKNSPLFFGNTVVLKPPD